MKLTVKLEKDSLIFHANTFFHPRMWNNRVDTEENIEIKDSHTKKNKIKNKKLCKFVINIFEIANKFS